MKLVLFLTVACLIIAVVLPAAEPAKLPAGVQQATESDARLHADGKGWRLDTAKIVDANRPRVLLVGDSILNGYLKQVTAALEGPRSAPFSKLT